ncbi:DUF3800 domain-containing protein [Streptomyces anulatus]|uniref:DUF3800 domain-containing protein n=1 Tax=Streptomyces anulatus TaxID=1892 RepID=UPI0036BED6B8
MEAHIASLPVVYADESMNSGQNLLDPNQPVFSVAGVHLPDDLAASIVDEIRAQIPPSQKEPKYTSLVRSSGGRKALMRAFAQLPEGSVRVSYAHKGFMVATKMVDILVEPLAHRDGLNLYENGALQLAGMLHLIGVTTGFEASHKKMQEAFVGWMRRQTSTDNLFASIAEHRKSVSVQSEELSQWLELLEHCRSVADATSPEDRDDSLDPAVPTLYVIAAGFREDLGDFRLVHDDSKVIDRHSANLSSVHLLPDVARPGKFNRQAASHISFADSLDHPQLQIADWTAGAVRQWATWLAVGGRDRFAEELGPVVDAWSLWGVWPPNPEG